MTSTPGDHHRETDARAAFVQWAPLQPGAPRNVAAVVSCVEGSDDHVGQHATEVHGRRVAWKSVPFVGKARVCFPTIAIESVDPWSVDSSGLRGSSDHIAMCEACGGDGKVDCGAYGSIGRTICATYGGQRKIYGSAANGARWLRIARNVEARDRSIADTAAAASPAARHTPAKVGCSAGSSWNGGNAPLRTFIRNGRPGSSGGMPIPRAKSSGRDADIVIAIDKPHRLTTTDIGTIPAQWLTQLAAALHAGERIARQRLRIARLPRPTLIELRTSMARDVATLERATRRRRRS